MHLCFSHASPWPLFLSEIITIWCFIMNMFFISCLHKCLFTYISHHVRFSSYISEILLILAVSIFAYNSYMHHIIMGVKLQVYYVKLQNSIVLWTHRCSIALCQASVISQSLPPTWKKSCRFYGYRWKQLAFSWDEFERKRTVLNIRDTVHHAYGQGDFKTFISNMSIQ